MAKRRRAANSGRYRMTPKRRAALRKAQAASARKRRKRAFVSGAKQVGLVAGSLAVGAAQHHVQKALYNPGTTYKQGKAAYAYAKGRFGRGGKTDANATANAAIRGYNLLGKPIH